MNDPVFVKRLTASQDAATNALNFPLYVYGVHLNGAAAATAVSSVLLFDAATATGTELIKVQTDQQAANIFASGKYVPFNPPVPFNNVSTTIAGSTGVTVDLYYQPK